MGACTLDLPTAYLRSALKVRYHDRWNQVVNYALSHRPVMTPTNNAADKMIDMVAAMVGSLSTLLTLDSSKQAGNPLNEWIDAVASEVAKIPEFCELILYKNESTLQVRYRHFILVFLLTSSIQDPTSQSTDTPGASEINIPQGSEASKVHSERESFTSRRNDISDNIWYTRFNRRDRYGFHIIRRRVLSRSDGLC